LTVDRNGDFVVIELKRDDVPRATIGQIAGYIAFVKKHLATSDGRSVDGWILARPSSLQDDRVLEESANAVGISVKWYSVRLELLEGSPL
jgi:RecB family endonuclease NucS